MKYAELLAGLNVFRSLGDHLYERFGLEAVLVGREDEAGLLRPRDGSPLSRLTRLAGASESLAALHADALQAAADARAGRALEHPLGFGMLTANCPIDGRSGRIVLLPFLHGDSERPALKAALQQHGAGERSAVAFADAIQVIDGRDVKHALALASVLSDEAERFAEAMARSERRLDRLRRQSRSQYGRIIGKSAPMQELFSVMERLVRSESTVYIHGENGTGKELVAAEIHEHSRRAGRPFVVQNCSALNDNLLESELFGHKRGAFTGAVSDKPGLFEQADSGTFFLDEIGDMSPTLQVKLLRVLQEGTLTPVGDTAARHVDVRVICATNRDLKRMVDDGTFREDLYYRINVINLTIPPLRDRTEDIPLLVDFFLTRTLQQMGTPDDRKRLTREAMSRLADYHWPGNVRELENEIERLVVMAGPLVTRIGPDMLSPHIRMRPLGQLGESARQELTLPEALEKMERAMIHEKLKDARWNKTRAAQELGISRRNLIRKVKQYGFDRRS